MDRDTRLAETKNFIRIDKIGFTTAMLVDSHCHLDFPDFDEERDIVVQRALDANIIRIITICTRVRHFKKILDITETYPEIFCSVGTHPNNAHEEQDITVEELIRLSNHPKVVAIGEAGLDYHHNDAPPEVQKKSFYTHIESARQTQMPLVIHARSADKDMLKILEDETGKGAFPFLLHCFSSGLALARTGIELGGYVSFSGILTFKNSTELRDIARIIPHNRLLVETDAPYLAPIPHRGKRNEPAYVRHTAAVLAETIGLEREELEKVTTQNIFRLFSKMSKPGNNMDG